MLERDQRRRERFPALQGVETVFMWIAILLLGAAVYTAFFGPSFF